MREYLVFQLYGALASWGDIAVGETRPSASTPGKSAVLGLIAAALGIPRPDTATTEDDRTRLERQHSALAHAYGLAVCVQVPGIPLTDYHTAQVPSSGAGRNRKVFATRRDELTWQPRADLNTILSRREYRQDAFAVCALWSREDAPYTLADIRDKLLEPRFPLYLGRKACPPALPLKPALQLARTLEDALATVDWHDVLRGLWDENTADFLNRKYRREGASLRWDADAETDIPPEQTDILTRRDLPLSRRRWQFAVRQEHYAAWPQDTRHD